MNANQFAEAVRQGNRLALARLLTHIENSTEIGQEALDVLFAYTGKAHLVGVTGAPGTGKSSLVNHLARFFRNPTEGQSRRVGIVAVDPSSPFSGGAILGDRVRMRDLAGDAGVFIRSMATRGCLGGLAAGTSRLVQALDAAGFEIILIETVGAGQAEVDIARLAHTTLVVEAPGLGDDIQAIKAGILEIADVLVVNKADRPGVESTERALRSMLQLAHPHRQRFPNFDAHHGWDDAATPWQEGRGEKQAEGNPISEGEDQIWSPPILRTVATEGNGVVELAEAINLHYAYLKKTGELVYREQQRLKAEVDGLLLDRLVKQWRAALPDEIYEQVLERVIRRETSPWQAVQVLAVDRAF